MTDTTARLVIEADARQVSSASNELERLSRSGRDTERSISGFSSSAASSLNSVKIAAAAAATAFIAIGRQSVIASNEFKKSLAEVSTLIDDTTGEMAKIERSAKSLAVQFGTDLQQQSKAYYQIISAGAADAAQATEILTVANRLAVGGVTDVATAADGLTSILNAYGSQVKSAADVSDSLFVAMKAGKTTIGELSSSLGRVAPIAASIGVSFDEVTAAVAALTKGGISTQESVTGLRAILASLAKPSAEASKLANQLGLEFNSTALKTKGLSGFLDDLIVKTGGSNDALSILFGGVEALVPAMALAGEAGISFNNILGNMENKAGETQTAFEKMANSPGFKIDQLFSAMSAAAVTLGDALANYLVPAAEKAAAVLANLFGATAEVSAIDQQKDRIAGLRKELDSLNNRKNVPLIGGLLFDKRSADLLEQQIDDAVADLGRMESALKTVSKAKEEAFTPSVNKALIVPKIPVSASARSTSKEISDGQRLIEINKRRLEQIQEEGRRLTESLDPLVKRNNEMARYQSLLDAGAIDDGIFNAAAQQSTENYLRALGFVEKETEEIIDKTSMLGNRTREVFDSMEQIAIQGVRNIQTAFADGIFNFFDRGLKGMVDSVITAVGRMASEFASIKLLQGVGGLFGLGGASSAFASGGGGIGSALNLASLGSSAANLFKTGFGATGLIGGGLSALGGSSTLGAFGAGMQGGSAGASFIAAESAVAGAGSAAGMGASFAAAAGPLIAAYATTALFRSFAGDKRMGGGFGKGLNAIGDIPIIGDLIPVVPLMNALFGRGPLKQGMTSLRGEIGTEGFESGDIRTSFRAKGGVFRSNKNDFTNIDAVTGEITTDNKKLNEYANSISKVSSEIIKSINETVTSVSSGLFDIADSMGLSTDALEGFSAQIKVVSEAGKFLDQAEIAEEISRITNEMASTLIPGLEDFSKAGETALSTIQRLSTEFDALVNAATILGLSLAESRDLIRGASITDRTAFVDASGGLEALSQKASFFADNFLTDAERLAPSIELLSEQMGELGFSANITKEEFKALVQSFGQTGGVTEETFQSLLNIAPLFVRVKDGIQGMNVALTDTLDLTERISTARNALITVYNRERSALQETALRFKELGFTLRDASDSLALSSLSPLTPEQKLDEARTQFNRDRLAANQGDQEALRRLPESGRAFLEASRVFNASSTEFTSDFRFVQGVLESAANLADVEAGVAEQQLARLEDQISRLIDIDESVNSVEDAIRELTEAVLQGGGNSAITDQQIREFVNTPGRTNQEIIDAAVKYGVSDDQFSKATGANLSDISVATGGASISDAQIRDFVNANINNPRAIYDAAKDFGISLRRVSDASGISYADIEQWTKQNNLPMFEKGTDFVQKGGIAMLHPAEAVTPASHMRDMAREISDLRKELSELRREQNQQTQALINVNLEANKINANMIIASNKDAEKSAAWRENNKVNVR